MRPSLLCPPPTHAHAEQYHSTPETQTDASYNHPEDIEHFAHHEKIEILEAEREAKFQGISVEEAMRSHDTPPISESKPKTVRGTPKEDPETKYKDIDKDKENLSEWGTGEEGYKQPRSPVEKMRYVLLLSVRSSMSDLGCRKNLPYKVCSHVLATETLDG